MSAKNKCTCILFALEGKKSSSPELSSANCLARHLWQQRRRRSDDRLLRARSSSALAPPVDRSSFSPGDDFLLGDRFQRGRERHALEESRLTSFLRLCRRVERRLEESLRTLDEREIPPDRLRCLSVSCPTLDDLFARTLRNADNPRRSQSCADVIVHDRCPSYYAWATPDPGKYRSRFLPMRMPDLVRDDLAYRTLVSKRACYRIKNNNAAA